jgi:4-amino-4-deoxy-L-arabinose transferase-like glycosyltransferase
MPVSALNALPGALARALPAGPPRAALASALAARVPTMLASVALAWLVWRWARRLWGERGGLLALLLGVFDPNLLAHARLVTTDVWIALAATAVLYLFWRFAEQPTWRRGLALALVLALAQVVKYSAVLLLPLLALLATLRWAPGLWRAWRGGERALARRRLAAAAASVALAALLALVVVNLAFLGDRTFTRFGDYRFRSTTMRAAQQRLPALAGLPVPVPYPYLEGLDWVHHRERSGEGYGRLYLRGELRERGGFRGYYLWAWLYKLPLPTQALLLAAAAVAWRRRRLLRWRDDLAPLLLPALLLAVHLNFFFGAQMGVRYSLLLFPPLYVFAGLLLAPGWWPLATARRTRAAALAIAAGVAWLVVSVLSWHPFYISYFNELLRDRKQAWRFFADSNLDWGQSEGHVKRWLAAHPQAVLEPPRPRTGLVVVRANFLTGVLGDDRFAWLRELEPVGHVGYSYLVFDVRPPDLPGEATSNPGP